MPNRDMTGISAVPEKPQPLGLFEPTTMISAKHPRRDGLQTCFASQDRSATRNGMQPDPLPQTLEKMISNQLSSVSAPIRRSESSESRSMSGSCWASDEAQLDEDNLMFSGSGSIHSTRSYSFIDGTHQFKYHNYLETIDSINSHDWLEQDLVK